MRIRSYKELVLAFKVQAKIYSKRGRGEYSFALKLLLSPGAINMILSCHTAEAAGQCSSPFSSLLPPSARSYYWALAYRGVVQELVREKEGPVCLLGTSLSAWSGYHGNI